jgi:hypothetical protein
MFVQLTHFEKCNSFFFLNYTLETRVVRYYYYYYYYIRILLLKNYNFVSLIHFAYKDNK